MLEKRKNTLRRTTFVINCKCQGRGFAAGSKPCGRCAVMALAKKWQSTDSVADWILPPSGERFFSPSASKMRSLLRDITALKGICAGCQGVGFHGFRRGRARDEYQDGTPLSRILELGGWKSSAALRYLALKELSGEVDEVHAINVAVEASDSDQ